MNAIDLLKADHRTCEALFTKFESASGLKTKESIARKICAELKIHTEIEEEIFYPALEGKIEEDLLKEAYVEHDGAKLLINDIEAGSADEEYYDAKVTVLKEQIKHHVKEEEEQGGMFAQAKKAGVDLDGIGEKMAALKKELSSAQKAGELGPAVTTAIGH